MHCLMMLSSVFMLATGSALESSGRPVEAGRAYTAEKDPAGQSRILAGFLEESLYSGNTVHAFDLLLQLEQLPVEREYYDFWYARLAWSCGLSDYSLRLLDSMEGSPWLTARAAGMSAQFRGDASAAADLYRVSIDEASSNRQRFYSALDLSFALLQAGLLHEAELVAGFLASRFPDEGLSHIALALCIHGRGSFSRSMTILQEVRTGDGYSFITRNFAASLIRDLE